MANQIVDQLSSFRIALGSNYIWATGKVGMNFRLQINDVFFGPFNLSLDKLVSFVRVHLSGTFLSKENRLKKTFSQRKHT